MLPYISLREQARDFQLSLVFPLTSFAVAAFDHLADATGAKSDDLKLVFSFVLSYPLAAVLKRIPDAKPYQKNLFIIGVDISGAQMVLVMKLTAFCWNVHDGRLPQKNITEFQRARALPKLPRLLDFTAYVLFFPSLFAGPAFDYIEYHRWIETSMFEVPPGTDPSKHPPTRKKRKIPRSGTPAAWKAAAGLFWIFAFMKFSGWYYPELLLGDEYMKYGFLRRVWILHMLGFTARLKFYGVWALTEGACILSGIGYKGVDSKTGKVHWNRLQNVNPWGIETAQNTRAYLENWNINTNLWLRNYMYLRVTPQGKKPGFRASMATFITSAFWHGFYPGYYMTFMLASFLQTVAKNFRRHVRPFVLTPDGTRPLPRKRYYDFLSYVVTQLAFSFAVSPFILLTFPSSFLVWSRVYFYAIVGTIASMAFFASPAKKWLIEQQKKRATPPKIRISRSDSTDSANGAASSRETEPILGLPNDPERELDEIIAEVKEEMTKRGLLGRDANGNGKNVGVNVGEEFKKAVLEKLDKRK
ncbi:MAG: hypothetical protein M1819_007403 [Sarea resinae]|nr:MAG: hypothetical protein M1819_007403 [Sarea resinae]